MEDKNDVHVTIPATLTAQVAKASAPEAPPPRDQSLDDLIALGVQKALERLQIPAAVAAPATPAAAVAASTLRPDADPNFVEGPGQERTEFEVTLLERHADWLRNVARANGVTPSHLLDVLVRRAWAADPTKGGTILVALPDEKGQPATTAPRKN
jgi:hypothetical protein